MTDHPDPPQPNDVGRRLFFRRFAGEVVSAATSVLGAAQALQQQSAETARDLLAGDVPAAPPAGFRTAFRWEGDICRVVDQRGLPDAFVEVEVRGVGDAVTAIRDAVVVGPAAAQVAAVGLALTAHRSRAARPHARRATLRGSANALRSARPSSAMVAAAVERVMGRFEALAAEADGDAVAAALRDEAESIVSEATDAHGRLVANGVAALPGQPTETLRVLTLGSTGTLASGQFGTALGVIQSAFHAGRPVEVVVLETRPGLDGSRVTMWELAQAGIPARVATDASVGVLLAGRVVDVVLLGAERVAANGDVVGPVGTYPAAVLADRHGVPVLVCVPTSAIDPATPDGAAARPVHGSPGEVTRVAGRRVAPEGASATNPVVDVTPAELLDAIVTEAGVHRPPFPGALAAALAADTAASAIVDVEHPPRGGISGSIDEGELAATPGPAPIEAR